MGKNLFFGNIKRCRYNIINSYTEVIMSLLDSQVLRVCLDNEVYAKISNLVKKDFFPRDLSTVVDTIHFCQDKYKTKLSVEDLLIAHREKFPALPESTRLKIEKEIQNKKFLR